MTLARRGGVCSVRHGRRRRWSDDVRMTRGEGETAYPAVDVIVLGIFVELSRSFLAVDHTASHGDGVSHDTLKEAMSSTGSQGVDPTFRESKIDGTCKVQRRC